LDLTRLFLLDVLSFAEVSKARYGFVAEQKRWAKKMLFFICIRFQSSTPLLYGILFCGHAHQFGIARQTLYSIAALDYERNDFIRWFRQSPEAVTMRGISRTPRNWVKILRGRDSAENEILLV